MKVDVEDVSTVKKVVHVEIPEEEVTRELDKAYSGLKKNVKIKGFRPGKVPRSILERRFKKETHAEVSGQLIQNSYAEAMQKAGVIAVGEPAIEPRELEESKSYHYSATVEVRPTIEDLETKGFELKKTVHIVTDEEIDTQVKLIQKRSAQLKTVDEDRPVENGDIALIDYEGLKNGKPFEPARKTENFLVELGSGRMLKDFDKQVVGMRVDTTKEFTVQFPKDYYNKDLAGHEITFSVSLNEIKEEVLPEIDDELAKDLGEYQTLDELKEALRKNLEETYKIQSEKELRNDIVDKLAEQFDFELPESLVEEELSATLKEAQDMMNQRGISLGDSGQTEEELSGKLRPVAEKKVRGYMLLHKVIEQEKITLTDEAISEAYEELVEATGQSIDSIKQFHNTYKDAYELFRENTLEKQAIKHIVENSRVETVEVSKEKSEDAQGEDSENTGTEDKST